MSFFSAIYSFLSLLFFWKKKENTYEEVERNDEEQGIENDQPNQDEAQIQYDPPIQKENDNQLDQKKAEKNLSITNEFQLKIQCSISNQQQENQGQQDFQILDIGQPYQSSQDQFQDRQEKQIQNSSQSIENLQQYQSNQNHILLELDQLDNQQDFQSYRLNDISQNDIKQQILIGNEQNQINFQDNNDLQNSFDSSELMKTQIIIQNCLRCNMQTKQDFFQTSCLHIYHLACFQEMIQQQIIQDRKPFISCQCNKKLNQKALYQVDQTKSIQLKEKLYQNQLDILKQNLEKEQKIQICQNQKCQYFCISQIKNGDICWICKS